MRMIARLSLALLLAAPLGCYAPPLKDDCGCCSPGESVCKNCGRTLKDGKPCECAKSARPRQ